MLRAGVMGLTLTGIIYSVERITQRSWSYTIALLGLLLLPRLISRQAVVWTSGFSNYSTSIFLTLIFFSYFNEHSPSENYNCSVSSLAVLFILGLCNTMIVEHLTVFHVIMSVSLFLYCLLKCNKIRLDYMIYMISCISGAIYMFSNSVYHSISVNADGYRQIAGGGIISRAINNYFGVIYCDGYFNNHFINIMLFVACVLLYRQFRNEQSNSKLSNTSTICLIIMGVFEIYSLAYFLLRGYANNEYSLARHVLFGGGLTLLNLFATILLTLRTTFKNGINHRLLLLWIAFIMMIAPLFAVTPIGSRCLFASYVVLIIIVCECFKCVNITCSELVTKIQRTISILGTISILCCAAYNFTIYFKVYQADLLRYQHIMYEIAQGSKVAELSHLPYEDRLWTATPFKDNDIWEQRYKLFYEIPDDVDLIIVE